MDWIDYVIRDLCELPDRSSPEDDPDAILATADEIRQAIEANFPAPTPQQVSDYLQMAKNINEAAINGEKK